MKTFDVQYNGEDLGHVEAETLAEARDTCAGYIENCNGNNLIVTESKTGADAEQYENESKN